MSKYDEVKPFSWYCPNCGHKVTGLKSADGRVKLHCDRCQVSMVRIMKTPRHLTIEVYAAGGGAN